MPELPEVETVRRGLIPAMEGVRIARVTAHRGDLRFPLQKDFAARLDGRKVTGLGRRAKFLLADLDSGDVLLIHLGMSGSFRVMQGDDGKTPGVFHHPRSENRTHDHVVFEMGNGAVISFIDPRRFGYMKIVARADLEDEPFLKALGPEPLGNAFDAAMLARACAGKKTSLKAALLDHRQTSGELGYFQHSFQGYDREGEPCRTRGCRGTVKRFTQNGRSTFWCPSCQK